MKKVDVKKILRSYATRKVRYNAFAEAVGAILESLLNSSGFNKKILSFRAKEVSSIKKNLEEKRYKGISKIEDISDLAGCRVIFYVPSHIDAFVKVLSSEFEIVDLDRKYTEDGYNALHVILKLKEERTNLTEYKQFKDLKCEVQLTTVLSHAWSELEHDIIYKPEKELKQFDPRGYEYIERKFKETMREYIKKAEQSFESIYKTVEEIRRGKSIFDPSSLQEISKLSSNDEIFQKIGLLKEQIIRFGDKSKQQINITKLIKQAIEQAKNNPVIKNQTPLGEIEGKTQDDIILAGLDVLGLFNVRYEHLLDVLNTILPYVHSSNPKISSKATEAIKHIAKYNMTVLKEIGYSIQDELLNELEAWDKIKMKTEITTFINILEQISEPSFQGTSMQNFETMVLHSGTLPPSDKLKKIRSKSIALLIKAYYLEDNLKNRLSILQILSKSVNPSEHDFGQDMEKILLQNVNQIIQFYLKILPGAENEIIKAIEEDFIQLQRRYTNKIAKADKVTRAFNVDYYALYKLFVGYDYLHSTEQDFQSAKQKRQKERMAYLESINETNFEKKQKELLQIIKNYSEAADPGAYNGFLNFLYDFGKQKPDLAFIFLEKNENILKPFIIQLVAGIWESEQSIIEKWIKLKIKNGQYLSQLATLPLYTKKIDTNLLDKIFVSAKNVKDAGALVTIIKSIIECWDNKKKTKKIFLDSIEELTKLKNASWVAHVWYKPQNFMENLNANEIEKVLDNLILLERIDFDMDAFLMPLVQRDPWLVLNFFGKRIDRKIARQKKRAAHKAYEWDGYDPIPSELRSVAPKLQNIKSILIPELLHWIVKRNWLYKWEASHLLKKIFPAFDRLLEKNLLELIKKGGIKNAKAVLWIIKAYDGEEFLGEVVKAFVKKFKQTPLRNELIASLSQTGVVSGEYGFVTAYESKKVSATKWKGDLTLEVKKFADEYITYLDKRIVEEKKNADDSIQERKRGFEGANSTPE